MNTRDICTHLVRKNVLVRIVGVFKSSFLGLSLPLVAASALITGCAGPKNQIPAQALKPAETQVLRSGDVIKISFPRAATLDTTQQIRRDGKINLYLVGEVQAAELSPAALEAKLLELYASQLVSREVRITVVSSAFSVFVTGAVLRPGKLTPDRPLTVLEAVMEAGGFISDRADTKKVAIIRADSEGKTHNYVIDLKAVLEGKASAPFYLQANDVVYVPERFSWF